MTVLDQYLSKYAAYHRDPRNIRTHFVGIPMIVFSLFVILQRAGLDVAGLIITPALLVYVFSTLFYLKLSIAYGFAMAVLHGVLFALALPFAKASWMVWATAGVGVFFAGWVIQLVGHYFEGRKPAFLDDLSGLIIGPLFVVAEFGFLLGLGKSHEEQVIRVTGPVSKRT